MAKTISDIYSEYKIMPRLQDHMLRVAAVASMICDNFDEPLPKKDIVLLCLLHDMGNIIKSNLNYFPEFLEPEGLGFWQGVQNEYFEKYGKDEHEATLAIMRELNVNEELVELLYQIEFPLMCQHRDGSDKRIKIITYSDNRVDPKGVVSFNERMEEARIRYKNKKLLKRPEEERLKLVACGQEIEKQVFSKCKIRPEDVNNETVAPIVAQLRHFII